MFEIKRLDYSVKILSIEKEKKENIMPLLLRCFLSEKDIFYNINEGDNELSLVIDTKFEKYFKKINCVIHPDIYKVIQIHENKSGIDHIGIVAQVSSLFSDINISILYYNTFNNNFILVKQKDYKKALEALEHFNN